MIESELLIIRIFLVKVALKIAWAYKIQDLNREKQQEVFMKENCC